ncbi:hypothetical protein C8Q76DRAFT_693811 [Earliella scabrosa]|nr:hypothetical protein C8Q76DRAFT_693811 [Earliella scabrosa]
MAHMLKDDTPGRKEPPTMEEGGGRAEAWCVLPKDAAKGDGTAGGERGDARDRSKHRRSVVTQPGGTKQDGGAASDTPRALTVVTSKKSAQGEDVRIPMDLDEYSPMADSPSPAERVRRIPVSDSKRGRGDQAEGEAVRALERAERMDDEKGDAMEDEDDAVEAPPATPRRPQKRRRKASIVEDSDLPGTGGDELPEKSQTGSTANKGTHDDVSQSRVTTRAMLRSMATHGTQTTQRPTIALNKALQKTKKTPQTPSVQETAAQKDGPVAVGDGTVQVRDVQATSPAETSANQGTNTEMAPPSGAFTFSPAFMKSAPSGVEHDLKKLDAAWGGQLALSLANPAGRPGETAPLMMTTTELGPTPSVATQGHTPHGGDNGLGMANPGADATQTPRTAYSMQFEGPKAPFPVRGTPNPVHRFQKDMAAETDADASDAALQFAVPHHYAGLSARPIIPTAVQNYGDAAKSYNLMPQEERAKGHLAPIMLYPSANTKAISGEEYIAGLTKCPDQGWPLRVKDHPCGFARGVPQEVAQQIHTMPEESTILTLVWGWPRVGAPHPEIIAGRLRNTIMNFLGGESGFSVTPPNMRWYEKVKLNALNAPAAYVVAGLSPQARNALIRQQAISAREITFFIHSNKMDAPIFVARFHRFPDPNAARNAIFEFFRSEWMYQITTPLLLKTHAGRDATTPKALFEKWVQTVRPIPARIPTDTAMWAVNVYCEPPTRHPVAWLAWAEDVRRMHIPIPNCGPYVAAFVGHIRCSACHSADHYDTECQYALVEGWKGELVGSVGNATGASLPPPPSSSGGHRPPEPRPAAKRGGRNGAGRGTVAAHDTSGVSQFARTEKEAPLTGAFGGYGLYPSL